MEGLCGTVKLLVSVLVCERDILLRMDVECLTLLDNDCECALYLLGICLLAAFGLDAMVLSFRACGQGAEVLSERAHICAGDNGRAGAATRITTLGCISGLKTGMKTQSICFVRWVCNLNALLRSVVEEKACAE